MTVGLSGSLAAHGGYRISPDGGLAPQRSASIIIGG